MIIDIFSRYVVGWMVLAGRDRRTRRGVHRRHPRPPRHRPRSAHPARRPGHVDDLQAGRPAARRPRCRPQPQPPPRQQRQPLLARRNFKTLKYCPAFPAASARSRTPGRSAPRSSITTTTSTATPASGCTPQRRSTTAPPARSAPNAPSPSTPPTPPTPPGSATADPTPPEAAHRRLDQRTHPRSTHQIRMRSCLTGLDRFRHPWATSWQCVCGKLSSRSAAWRRGAVSAHDDRFISAIASSTIALWSYEVALPITIAPTPASG